MKWLRRDAHRGVIRSGRATRHDRRGRGATTSRFPSWRARLLLLTFLAGFTVLIGRAVYLQGVNEAWLQARGDKRFIHTELIQANRGQVLDRHGALLAGSVPTRSIWLLPSVHRERDEANKAAERGNARALRRFDDRIVAVANALGIAPHELNKRISEASLRRVLLERHMPLARAEAVRKLRVNWVEEEFSYLRHYTAGEVAAHVVGFTDSNQKEGLAGVERSCDRDLQSSIGTRRVMYDRARRVLDEPQAVESAIDGRDITLAIDSRLQMIAHHALKQAMTQHRAVGGGVMVVDVQTGEILALANAPTFDPNQRADLKDGDDRLRNQAVSSLFEPGSTIKPLVIAAALERGRLKSNMVLDTYNGRLTVGHKTFTDSSPMASMSVTEIVQKSSNVGSIRIAMEFIERDAFASFLRDVGFGSLTRTGMPGESLGGRLRPVANWKPIDRATMAFGHSVSVNMVQLARAYTPLARNGDIIPLTIIKQDSAPEGQQVMSPQTARQVREMLEQVVSPQGTAPRAQLRGYRAGGKTGTARKLEDGRYTTNKHVASFVGFAPISAPRLIVVVLIDEPRAGQFYGGVVAAPIFADIMSQSLRILNVATDKPLAPIQLPPADEEVREVTG